MGIKYDLAYACLRPLVILFLKLKFGYKYKIAKNLPENYIVLSNHVTDFDPLFVASSFPQQMFFVASEHITRWGLASTLLDFFFKPIIRYKATVAASTVKDVLKSTRNGKNVCLFAEGIRTWDGITWPILPSTGKMVKKAKCGLVTYKLTGGYFVSPNWSLTSNTRRGPIYGEPVGIYTKEQLDEMSADEINAIIVRDLKEDAYERQLKSPQKYKGKNLAEQMENFLFICPKCGKIDTVYSKGDMVYCKECDMQFQYTEYGMLDGIEQTTMRDLSKWQRAEVEKTAASGGSYFSEDGTLSIVKDQTATLVSQGKIVLTPDSLLCGEKEIPLSQISDMGIHGRHELVISAERTYYELRPNGTNALKFLWLYEGYKKQK